LAWLITQEVYRYHWEFVIPVVEFVTGLDINRGPLSFPLSPEALNRFSPVVPAGAAIGGRDGMVAGCVGHAIRIPEDPND